MGEFVCTEADGWSGIVAALASARPGDVVRLRPGLYAGGQTLWIPSGVTLIGEDGVVLRFDADAPAVRFRGATDSGVANLRIEMVAEHVALRALPDDPPAAGEARVEWGLIDVEDCNGISVSSIEIAASRDRHENLNGIALRSSDGCSVTGCRITSVGLMGILLASSQAVIEGNDVARVKDGICLHRSARSLDRPSQASLKRNRCHDNTEAGIVLLSSEADTIEENECWANRVSGIVLERDENSRNQPSRARLIRNHCHDNTESGIVLFSSEAETVEENDCWANRHGISLQRDPRSLDQPSQARLHRNRCHDNTQSGIVLFSSEADTIDENECWANRQSGIALERDKDSRNQPSWANLKRNCCHHNTKAGIVLLSSEADTIEENESWANETSGIVLTRSKKSSDQPSRAPLKRNRCHDNIESGIALFSSRADTIEENECWANKINGICLLRDEKSPDQPCIARIIGNICGDNLGAGFALLESIHDHIAV